MNPELASLFFQALHDCTYVNDRRLRDDAVYEVISCMRIIRKADAEVNNGLLTAEEIAGSIKPGIPRRSVQ